MGIGVDALEVERMRVAVARTPTLLARLFTERERASCVSRCGDLKIGGLAARFAAKEAVAKALGTGIAGFGFRDIEVLNDADGRPLVRLHAGAAAAAAQRGVAAVHVSLTKGRELVMANAVAESGERSPRARER